MVVTPHILSIFFSFQRLWKIYVLLTPHGPNDNKLYISTNLSEFIHGGIEQSFEKQGIDKFRTS